MELFAAVLAGFVGALIGLVIALLSQSSEDRRLRQAEEWRQQSAKRERLRTELEVVLTLLFAIDASTTIQHWVTPSLAATDLQYRKLMAELEALYKQAKAADIRLRLEGAVDASQALNDVIVQHQAFRVALAEFEQPGPRTPTLQALAKAHNAIAVIVAPIDRAFAVHLASLTPPGPASPPSGLQSWLRQAGEWLSR